jgi:transposase InsO family protein
MGSEPATGIKSESLTTFSGISIYADELREKVSGRVIREVPTAPRSPWQNRTCESYFKPVKYKEVYRTEYRDVADARAGFGGLLEKVYNQKRLRPTLSYLPRAEFERSLRALPNKEAPTRSGQIPYEFSDVCANLSFR